MFDSLEVEVGEAALTSVVLGVSGSSVGGGLILSRYSFCQFVGLVFLE
ncbi:hypothetical protein RAM_29725 [Amycolatopsis mediterranei S699]|uniref:Uncharacterized protein n=1 Tax=Amycolatopsis mediterranei (strain S699) TaxID=713604 RepID=A0A9R0P190_AMYMS|nr:hypothetical protein RAM_29725 [Amycolatopsis mediterranei S699]